MDIQIVKEESKYSDDDQQTIQREFKLYKFDYSSLQWFDTKVNLNGFITERLDKYQYLYIEETDKVLFLGLKDDPWEVSYASRQKTNFTIDTLGACWAQISMRNSNSFEYMVPFSVPKSKFASIKVESQIFIIGGNDDLKTWYQYDLNAKHFEGQYGILDAWIEISSLNTGRYSTSVCLFDHRFVYVFGGRSNYGVYLNNIEVLDTQLNLISSSNPSTLWKTIPLVLPQSIWDSFSEQIDSQQLIILGGKIKSQK